MDLDSLIITVFCRIDDILSEVGRVRRSGPAPTLIDAEVLTMEVVGEYLGIMLDKRLFSFFRDHYAEAAYIQENPVKAGICARVEDWPYSSVHLAAGDATSK